MISTVAITSYPRLLSRAEVPGVRVRSESEATAILAVEPMMVSLLPSPV